VAGPADTHEVQRDDRNRKRRSITSRDEGSLSTRTCASSVHIWRAARMQLENPGSCCQVAVRAAPNVIFRAERALVQGGTTLRSRTLP
jgi:hypothetical protein